MDAVRSSESAMKAPEQRPGTIVRQLLPCIGGLALARGAYAALSPTSIFLAYNGFSDLAAAFRIAAMAVTIAILLAYGARLNKRQVNAIMLFSIFLCMGSLAVLFALEVRNTARDVAECFYIVGVICSISTFFYWFRRLRGCSPATVIVALCGARIIYETMAALMMLATPSALYLAGIGFLLGELACVRWSRFRRRKRFPLWSNGRTRISL